jgi:hypothetical protein
MRRGLSAADAAVLASLQRRDLVVRDGLHRHGQSRFRKDRDRIAEA